ncbi:hypothetical protein [Sediminibacillus sp. JSM 1682029]|uniref:hypothetical protein n=1 Tax=Sediminibacillus sp. JSM 1682029 TaxID=3229857 RepID=UPI003524D892
MEKELREQKLKEIQKSEPYMSGIRINYDGQNRAFNAYRIPLEYLIYNKYNGRVGSEVKSYERQYRELNPENKEDKKVIEEFLWNSYEKRNKRTEKNLVEMGQQVYGIVTSDGIIIDGNRRASLLNRIYKNRESWQKQNHNIDACKYFIAIILPENAGEKAVQKLETTYQLGADEKLDYNPTEKYLKCKDLKRIGFSEIDIANMMGENKSTIEKWLGIMDLMDDYLDYLEYSGIYTRLEKREGPMVDLYSYLKSYDKGTKSVTWDYDEMDVTDLKTISFDYIRAQYEGKEFRSIAKPSKKDGIFCNEKIWEDFREYHFNSTTEIEEESVEDVMKKNPDANMSKLLTTRDKDWKKKVKNQLKNNLKQSESKIDNIKQANKPVELLNRAKNSLLAINGSSLKGNSEEALLVKEIENILKDFKDVLPEGTKSL